MFTERETLEREKRNQELRMKYDILPDHFYEIRTPCEVYKLKNHKQGFLHFDNCASLVTMFDNTCFDEPDAITFGYLTYSMHHCCFMPMEHTFSMPLADFKTKLKNGDINDVTDRYSLQIFDNKTYVSDENNKIHRRLIITNILIYLILLPAVGFAEYWCIKHISLLMLIVMALLILVLYLPASSMIQDILRENLSAKLNKYRKEKFQKLKDLCSENKTYIDWHAW